MDAGDGCLDVAFTSELNIKTADLAVKRVCYDSDGGPLN